MTTIWIWNRVTDQRKEVEVVAWRGKRPDRVRFGGSVVTVERTGRVGRQGSPWEVAVEKKP